MRRDVLIALVLFALALWYNLAHVRTTEFHRDEARWIHRARFVRQLADPLGPYWHDRDLTRGQPPLGSYLMGVGLAVQGRDLATNGLWNFRKSDAWNQWHGRMPTRQDLIAARRTDSVVGALVAVCAFFIARRLFNPLAGVVAALLLIPHGLSVYLSSLAGSDALLTLLVALAALAAAALADRPTWPRAVLLGVLLGLGGATKLSPLALAVPLAGLGLVLLWRNRRGHVAGDPPPGLGWQLLALPSVAYATFVAAYPYLWPDPIGRTLSLFRFRAQEMANQGQIWEGLAVTSRVEALGRVGFWLAEFRSTTGWLASSVAGWFGRSWEPVGIDLPLALIGALVLVTLVVRHGLFGRHALVAAILGGEVAAIVLGMRADFERYLYPVLLAVAVCAGIGVAAGWDAARGLIMRWLASRRAVPKPAIARAAVGRPAAALATAGFVRRSIDARRARPKRAARSRARAEIPKVVPATIPPRSGTARARLSRTETVNGDRPHPPSSERVAAARLRSDAIA